jgi:hypothetical protein
MGLELNVPRSLVERNGSGAPVASLHCDSVPTMREGLVPPPDTFNGGDKRTVPDREHAI